VSHPVSLGGILVVAAILNSLFLGKLISRWLFYILFLVFLGGVIVVLLFIVSICGNEKFFYTGGLGGLPLLVLGVGVARLSSNLTSTYRSFNGLAITLTLYQSETALTFVMFILILVLCLIRVVKIRRLESGPLVKRL
jgi:hypothetical protein